MATFLLQAALLLAQAGANWVPAGSEPRGSYAYDSASVSRSGDIVRVRIRVIMSAIAPGGVRTLVMDVGLGCSARTMTAYAMSTYGDGGALIESHQAGPGESVAQPLPANTIEDAIRQRLCG